MFMTLGLLDPKDRGTILFQNVTIYQSTWHNIPKELNQVSSRLSNFTIIFNTETCEQNKIKLFTPLALAIMHCHHLSKQFSLVYRAC
jgi:hypothetical protein